MTEGFKELARALREELEAIPASLRQEEEERQTAVCLLHAAVRQMGLLALPAWKPPRSTRDRLDLVGVVPGSHPPEVRVAFVVDPLVELAKIKALEWVECPDKVVVTFSRRTDKVKQSTFFLAPGLGHVDVFGQE